MNICPHCKRPFPPPLRVGGTRRQAMVDYIAKHPEGVTVWQILGAVYADDPNGGPEKHNLVSVMAHQANTKLIDQGWKINATGGPGSRYTLVKL